MTQVHALGRHPDAAANHDPRSLAFPAAADNPIVDVTWPRRGRVLDQGQVGSCTGNAAAQACNHVAYYQHYRNEDAAVALYTRATQIDPYQGSYPNQDTGSDGLSVAKATVEAGYITSYTHAFGLDHVLSAAMDGPLIVGTDWYSGMFTPDAKYQVHPTSGVAGGHEYCLDGVSVTHRMLRFLNSWGAGWGKRGRFYISFDDFAMLLNSGGDATAFVL